MHQVTIELERHTRYGNRSVSIKDITRTDIVVVHVVVEILRPVGALTEGDFSVFIGSGKPATFNMNPVGTVQLIGQSGEFIESELIGDSR